MIKKGNKLNNTNNTNIVCRKKKLSSDNFDCNNNYNKFDSKGNNENSSLLFLKQKSITIFITF